MGTTQDDIRGWLEHGKAQGATHMVVIVDTFDHGDYPKYVMPGQDARTTANSPGEMQRVMEVYSYALPLEPQLAEHRAMHFETAGPALPAETVRQIAEHERIAASVGGRVVAIVRKRETS